MRDDDRRPSLRDSIQCSLYYALTSNIDRASSFVKDKYLRLLDYASSDGDSLTLATAELDAALTNFCIITLFSSED